MAPEAQKVHTGSGRSVGKIFKSPNSKKGHLCPGGCQGCQLLLLLALQDFSVVDMKKPFSITSVIAFGICLFAYQCLAVLSHRITAQD